MPTEAALGSGAPLTSFGRSPPAAAPAPAVFYAASNADVSAAARSVLDWDLRAAHPCSEWSGLTCVGNHSFLRVAALNLTSKGRAPQGALTVRLEHLCA